MLLTKKHLGRPDFGRFLSGICCWGKQWGFGDCWKNPAIFCLKIEGLENGVCTVLGLLSTSIFVNRFVVVIYLVPVCKVLFSCYTIFNSWTMHFQAGASSNGVSILAGSAVDCSNSDCWARMFTGYCKRKGGEGLPSAFCLLSVFVEEHWEQSFLFAPFESTRWTAPLHKISVQSVHIQAFWINESVSLLVNTKFMNGT